jgi:hypothetical protein
MVSGRVEKIATEILKLLDQVRRQEDVDNKVDGRFFQQILDLSVPDINDAFWLLKDAGFVDSIQYLETADFDFTQVWITPLGRYEAERLSGFEADPIKLGVRATPQPSPSTPSVSLPPTPIGSPYGFKDEDWELIAAQRSHGDRLYVVMGYQFRSEHYQTDLLQKNVEAMLADAVDFYNRTPGSLTAELVFRPLAAGYGEHLFNEIARDIIAADIAVFDTSDLNPNVMIELGVALTWGTRALLIRHHKTPVPPSDISGHTWTSYEDSAAKFLDPSHQEKLVRMVERAVRKKGRRG